MSFDGSTPAELSHSPRPPAASGGSEHRRILVLGGIRSGKSEFAESLVANDQSVRYVATGSVGDDTDFAERIAAHQLRRPGSWDTVEAGDDPHLLIATLEAADADQTLLVDDLGNWAAAALLDREGSRPASTLDDLAQAVRASRAKVVLVSPEVGLSVVPSTTLGARFADQLGLLNQAVAAACDAVALVVAGQPAWIRAEVPAEMTTAPGRPPVQDLPVPAVIAAPVAVPRPAGVQSVEPPQSGADIEIGPKMGLPIPDDDARTAAEKHLALLDIPGSGLGTLVRTVKFAAGTQGQAVPAPWRSPRLVLVRGDHEGDIAAGEKPSSAASTAEAVRRGEGPIGILAAEHGVSVQVVETATAGPIEFAEAVDDETVEAALRLGWRIAEDAVDSGVDLLILGACGAGAQGAAAAVVSAVTGAELPALLARVVSADGAVDDAAWMLRCAAARDAKHRVRGRSLQPRELLRELGGADMAVAAGVILGATSRRTPVLVDGPLAAAAGLVARDLGSQSRLWCALPDHGQHPTTRTAADVLGLVPLLDLKVSLGEGATALLALPLLRSALALVAALPTLPPVLSAPPEFLTGSEPESEIGSEAGSVGGNETGAEGGSETGDEVEPETDAVTTALAAADAADADQRNARPGASTVE